MAGMCQPVTLSSNGNVNSLTVLDTSNVYWTTGYDVRACPKTGGCDSGTLLYTVPNTTALDNTVLATPGPTSNLLFTIVNISLCGPNSFELAELTKAPAGGSITASLPQLTGIGPVGSAYDPAGPWLYMIDGGGLYRVKPDGSQFSTFASGVGGFFSTSPIFIASQSLYVADNGNNRVISCDLSGTTCSMAPVMTVKGPLSVYSDGTNVWVASYLNATSTAAGTGTISRCNANTNCQASPDTMAVGQALPTGIVADAHYVYWTTQSAAGGSGQVLRCAVTGCSGMPTAVATTGMYAWGLAADDAALYWSDTAGIKKLAK
jgi:hypothetical protein